LGSILGLWWGGQVVIIYRRFFHFPAFPFRPDWTAFLWRGIASAPLLFWALATPCTKVFDSNTPDIGLSSGRSILSSVLDRKTGLSHPIGCFENNKE
jgi:hypothetical protein